MKISYIHYKNTDFDSSISGGAAKIQIVNTCSRLADLGHDINLFCRGNAFKYANKNGMNVKFETTELNLATSFDYLDRIIYYTTSLLKSKCSDVIYTRDISFLKYLSYCPYSIDTPIVYEAHKAYWGLNELNKDDERQRINMADIVVTHSKGVEKDLNKIGICVDKIIPSAANVDQIPNKSKRLLREELKLPQNKHVIVYAGSLNRDKIGPVIIGYKYLLSCHSNTQLIIIGGCEQQCNSMRVMANNLNIDSTDINIIEKIPHDKVFKYLGAADIGLVPLSNQNKQTTNYTSPVKLYEYLVSNLMIVAAEVPAITEQFESKDYVITYDNCDPTSFASACEIATEKLKYTEVETDQYTYKRRAEEISKILSKIE